MMIARIVVGSGSRRTVVTVPTDRDVRRDLAGRIKRALFPTNAGYHRAKRRGDRALASA